MPLKTPPYWYRAQSSPPPFAEMALGLLARPYQWGHKINQSYKSAKKAPLPILCVGNAVAGGSGKTPVCLALIKIIRKHGISSRPFILTRGYGGSIKEPMMISTELHSHYHCGDEALMLARSSPTIIAPKRIDAAELAALEGADLGIMDDGLQHGGIIKDLTFMVIDGQAGFGNLKTLPAGPLREPLSEAIAKTDAFILIGKDKRGVTNHLPENKPLFAAHIEPVPASLPEKGPIVAFAGLGRPEKFYHFLQDLGYEISAWHPYPDHHNFTNEDLDMLSASAKEHNATLVTTEKDYMRLLNTPQAKDIKHIAINAVFSDEGELVSFLKDRLQ